MSNEKPSAPFADKFADAYDFILLNSDMDEKAFTGLIRCVSKKKKNKAVLVVVTRGGSANSAYKIGRYMQSVYDEFVVFVPSMCKSAGTLLATAANELIVSPFGEMGPLDVQLFQKDEIAGNRSGLTTRSAISDLSTHTFQVFEHFVLSIVNSSGGAVSFKLAAEISATLAGNVMSKIYEQINPDSLGQDYRDLTVATEYCERLNNWSKNMREGSINRLVNDYPSHDFVIDLEEAREIFERVDGPTETLYLLMRYYINDFMKIRMRGDQAIKMLSLKTLTDQDDAIKTDTNDDTGAQRDSDGTEQRSQEGNAGGASAAS